MSSVSQGIVLVLVPSGGFVCLTIDVTKGPRACQIVASLRDAEDQYLLMLLFCADLPGLFVLNKLS